ncbi:hypothetical protein DBR17_08335 [Sphingomonas sp. HMWF008]|nr:hypothetical protein DBR17_08335 [Sphingomonas sp. HMWF008]
MKRSVAKIAFVGAFLIAAIAIAHFITRALPWTFGLGGALGAVVFMTTPKLFDRIWTKPMKGWAE